MTGRLGVGNGGVATGVVGDGRIEGTLGEGRIEGTDGEGRGSFGGETATVDEGSGGKSASAGSVKNATADAAPRPANRMRAGAECVACAHERRNRLLFI